MVLRSNNLEIKLIWFSFYFIKPLLQSSPNEKMLSLFKRGAIYLLKSAHKFWKHCFVIFWEALQFEEAVPRLHIFHMELHPSTHVQLKIPIVDV